MSENSLTLPRRYARFSWITRMFITAIIIFINRFSMSCLPVSVAARLSVEAIGRLELLRPRRDEVGLSTDPCWPQRSISMLLPLILPTLSWRKQKSRDNVTQLDFFTIYFSTTGPVQCLEAVNLLICSRNGHFSCMPVCKCGTIPLACFTSALCN